MNIIPSLNEYLITYIDKENGKKYCYKMGCSDPDKVRAELKEKYDWFRMDLIGD